MRLLAIALLLSACGAASDPTAPPGAIGDGDGEGPGITVTGSAAIGVAGTL